MPLLHRAPGVLQRGEPPENPRPSRVNPRVSQQERLWGGPSKWGAGKFGGMSPNWWTSKYVSVFRDPLNQHKTIRPKLRAKLGNPLMDGFRLLNLLAPKKTPSKKRGFGVANCGDETSETQPREPPNVTSPFVWNLGLKGTPPNMATPR